MTGINGNNNARSLKSIADLVPDAQNANAGTERGRYILQQSIEKLGAGRSIVVDAQGAVIAGNKTLDIISELGLDIKVIKSDGSALIVHQRVDIDIDTPEGRALAIADNRASEVGLEWDSSVLLKLSNDVDLSQWWHQEELKKLIDKWNNELNPSDQGDLDIDADACKCCGREF